MRSHDWRSSPLGLPETWPQSLRTVVSLLLNSKFPMFVAWGPQLAFLYNDGYLPIFGAKHPKALGRPFAEVWSEIWDDIGPLVDRAMAGEATFHEDLPLRMLRHGYPEDTWFTFSYSPVHDESGGVGGMFCACFETTGQIVGERRLRDSEARWRGLFERMQEGFYVGEALARRRRPDARFPLHRGQPRLRGAHRHPRLRRRRPDGSRSDPRHPGRADKALRARHRHRRAELGSRSSSRPWPTAGTRLARGKPATSGSRCCSWKLPTANGRNGGTRRCWSSATVCAT